MHEGRSSSRFDGRKAVSVASIGRSTMAAHLRQSFLGTGGPSTGVAVYQRRRCQARVKVYRGEDVEDAVPFMALVATLPVQRATYSSGSNGMRTKLALPVRDPTTTPCRSMVSTIALALASSPSSPSVTSRRSLLY
jgi:hypothetical protein